MFIVVLKQDGGCDYTIGCGTVVYRLVSKTMEDAIDELVKYEGDDEDIVDYYGGSELTNCDIYEVSDSFDFLKLHNTLDEAKKKLQLIKEKARDKAKRKEQYKKLKMEFETNE